MGIKITNVKLFPKRKEKKPKPVPIPEWAKEQTKQLKKIQNERNPRPVRGRGIKNVPGAEKKKKPPYNPYAK